MNNKIAIYIGDLTLEVRLELYYKLISALGLKGTYFSIEDIKRTLWFSIEDNQLQIWISYKDAEKELEESIRMYEESIRMYESANYELVAFSSFITDKENE
jgi:hypothetical protein